jgi:hypothetical protein
MFSIYAVRKETLDASGEGSDAQISHAYDTGIFDTTYAFALF